MFEAGIFGTIEDLGLGVSNVLCDLFTPSGKCCSGGNKETADDDFESHEVNVAGIRTYYGDLIAGAKGDIKEIMKRLMDPEQNEKLGNEIELARAAAYNVPDEQFYMKLLEVFTERMNKNDAILFTAIMMAEWAEWAKANGSSEETKTGKNPAAKPSKAAGKKESKGEEQQDFVDLREAILSTDLGKKLFEHLAD